MLGLIKTNRKGIIMPEDENVTPDPSAMPSVEPPSLPTEPAVAPSLPVDAPAEPATDVPADEPVTDVPAEPAATIEE
jgi:hypothetical protein